MTESDQKYLDAQFDRVHDALKAHAELNASEHRGLHGRIRAEEEARKTLSSRLWGIAAGTLLALVGALIALATGHPAQ